MRVSQVLCAAGPVDAVTNQAFACRALFARWGWEGSDYSPVIAPGIPRTVMRPLSELEPADGEPLLLHYSGYARGLERLLERWPRTLLLSHNITPARYFWPHEPVEGVRCELARAQLAELARRAGALAGVSEFNAAELREMSGRDAAVIPVLFERGALGGGSSADGPPAGSPPAGGPPRILFVGRLAPHKRQDLVIRAFGAYRRQRPDASLTLVGTPMSPDFGAALGRLAESVAPGAVVFEHGVPPARLAEHYRRAHAFLSLSEHEGFCIPLLEAFHFGVPVIARNGGAVGEVLGDAGLLLGFSDGLGTVAEALRIVIDDPELCGELRMRGARRLEHYEYERTANTLRDNLMALAAA